MSKYGYFEVFRLSFRLRDNESQLYLEIITVVSQMKFLPVSGDCLMNLLHNDYTGTVSVTNHGITCQTWLSQTPHRHETTEALFEDVNYCRKFDSSPPWCFTMDPYIRWQYCTFAICNGDYKSETSREMVPYGMQVQIILRSAAYLHIQAKISLYLNVPVIRRCR